MTDLTAAQAAILLIDEVKGAMNRHRWCWACGTTGSRCAARQRHPWVGRRCCTDCRHDGWPEELDLDPDPEGTLARTIQALTWKAGGTVEFTEADLVAMQAADLAPAEMMMSAPFAGCRWAARVRIPGFQGE